MAIPPGFTGLPNQLMSEEDIRQYFVRNGGVVKNNDIVNYFRTYLSNPAIKDEARVVFKTYVNKLASVKVENGEKFLVLKRQYFPPIDGNGNSSVSGRPSTNNYSTPQYSQHHHQQLASYSQPSQANYSSHSQPGYNQQLALSASQQRLSVSSSSSHHFTPQMNQYPGGSGGGGGGVPPPYGYPPPVNNLRRQNSQNQIYGSHFSLNSNYADPYAAEQFNNNGLPLQQSQYYQQMSGLGHAHGGSTFSLASQYTTASSAGVPPYSHHQQQQVHLPLQNAHLHNQQPHHNVQAPQLQRSLSQMYALPHHQPVSQTQHYSQHQQQSYNHPHPKNNFSGYSTSTPTTPSGQVDYPPEYGLPALNSSSVSIGSPPNQHHHQQSFHRHLSPQNSSGSGNNSALYRAPPPYRPPPPAANNSPTAATPPSGLPPPVRSTGHSQHQQHMRRSSLSSSSMSGAVSGVRFDRNSTSVPPGPMMAMGNFTGGSTQNINSAYTEAYNVHQVPFQYQRSVSVSGLPGGTVQGTSGYSQSQSDQLYQGYPSDASINSLQPGAPPPPVPPRHKRGLERSPSAVSGHQTNSSVNQTGGANFGGNRHSNRRNMELTNGNGSSGGIPIGMNGGMENNHDEKENINFVNGTNGNFEDSSASSDGPSDGMQNGDSESEHKISVKERMQKFNRIASESELEASKMTSRSKREIAMKHESADFDTASLSSLEPRAKEWMLKSAQCDYHGLYKLAQENPSLVRRRDINGYTCLHWAAKKGHLELVKMLAGTYQCDVNAKSNGGYTPLHMAAQFSRQEIYDILLKAYNADANIRDHSGKKPMQYLVRQDTSVSMDTFKSESLSSSPSPSSSVSGTRIRRHFSSASSNYRHNIENRSSSSSNPDFYSISELVSLPTCNSNSASSSVTSVTPSVTRRFPSSANSSPRNSVHLLSITPLFSANRLRESMRNSTFFNFPDSRRSFNMGSSTESTDNENVNTTTVDGGGNGRSVHPGSGNSNSNFRGGTPNRRSLRQGFKYFMNNAVPKKKLTKSSSDESYLPEKK